MECENTKDARKLAEDVKELKSIMDELTSIIESQKINCEDQIEEAMIVTRETVDNIPQQHNRNSSKMLQFTSAGAMIGCLVGLGWGIGSALIMSLSGATAGLFAGSMIA